MTATLTRTYDYEVLDGSGKRRKGSLDASSEATAAATLRAQGAMPLSITESGSGLRKDLKIPGLGNRVKLKDLSIFARQFATMTSSGLTLLRALAVLEEQTEKPALRAAIRDLRHDVEGGQTLSGSMARHEKIFPPLMIAMIRAGETGGFLDQALDRIAVNFEKDSNLRGKIKSALTYPVIVVCFSILMIAGVLIFIVPVFERMFKQFGGKLPLPTQIIVTLSHQMIWIAPVSIISLGLAVSGFRNKLRKDYRWRLAFDAFKLRLPVFGSLLKKIAISRFSRNFGTLLAVGVPVMQALDVVGGTTGNAVIGEAMKEVQASVRDGQPMSTPLHKNDLFPDMVVQMMQVGEETGQISAMLEKISDFYDHEVEVATESLTASIEPIMVVLMGAIVGSMVICLYMPMFTIYQHIGG